MVHQFILQTENRYREEIQGFLDVYRREPTISGVLAPLLEEISTYLFWLRWVGWNITYLAPALFKDFVAPSHRLSLGMLAYAGGRLIDDGLDNHETYKDRHPTLVGILRKRLPGKPQSAACMQSGFIGFSLFHHALQRMRVCGYSGCAKEVSRLFEISSTGILAEAFVGPEVDAHLYQQIIRRKAVAYNMILYKPFLDGVEVSLRSRLLPILAGMDEIAQILNDYHDWQDDLRHDRLNALTHGVFRPETSMIEAYNRLTVIQRMSEELPPPVQDALKGMFASLNFPTIRETKSETAQ